MSSRTCIAVASILITGVISKTRYSILLISCKLLTNIRSLHEINKIEYLVLEMTPVISIDATAIHVLEDIVKELDNNHGIKVAFAMVGNRAYKTMRLAGTLQKIGEHWFFPSVNA